ncbi:MAG TPA: DUF58 domain-containing protein [Chthoniobacteraceae bacterium]|jgi:uncharacterized protein (DUF58 family)
MLSWPEASAVAGIHGRMQVAAQRLRLPFRGRTWRGESGNWQGAGVGSSIDFQDHRQYLPGDDPRYIDWQAYARTGHYTMKLYREEVSPRVDLVLDVSPSMFFDQEKSIRALELFYFAAESAQQAGSSLRCHVANGSGTRPWMPEAMLGSRELPRIEEAPRAATAPAFARVPWRQGSMRVIVSDLLFPGSPEPLLASLATNKGRGLIFVPHCSAEVEPDWSGNLEMVDCETDEQRVQHIGPDLLARYVDSYARHFAIWKEQARRHAVLIARVAAESEFHEALRSDAMRAGAVEWTQ